MKSFNRSCERLICRWSRISHQRPYVFVSIQGLGVIPDVSSQQQQAKSVLNGKSLNSANNSATTAPKPTKGGGLMTTTLTTNTHRPNHHLYPEKNNTNNIINNPNRSKSNTINIPSSSQHQRLASKRLQSTCSSGSPPYSSRSTSESSSLSGCMEQIDDDWDREDQEDFKSNTMSARDFELEDAKSQDDLLMRFRCALSDEKEVEWSTLLINGVLYVDIPNSVLPKGSRDSFVSLLEFAEEKLECDKVFVCFKRSREDRQSLMRVFMFFGFSLVSPGYNQVPQEDDIMSMVYKI